ncbi:MAG: hypothetical protein U0M42_04625 [Acutalibacteraceae bacterium]|nr:hypothetical protein [Acutalibacteraceae bacterium]
MAENNFNENCREAVCIDAGRVYDSCCDRDCLEDLRCYLTSQDQNMIQSAVNVRLKNAEVLNVYVDVEQVNFNKGFYSCDLTFFFLVELDVFTSQNTLPNIVKGICTFSKKVILYGGEGNAKIFSNITSLKNPDTQLNATTNLPKCVVQTVSPVPLSAKICKKITCCENVCCIPDCICRAVGNNICTTLDSGENAIYVTLGLFTVVQLIRNVQMLVPVYDFCIPEKQCDCNCGAVTPCDVFSKIDFPTSDFFPPSSKDDNCC